MEDDDRIDLVELFLHILLGICLILGVGGGITAIYLMYKTIIWIFTGVF